MSGTSLRRLLPLLFVVSGFCGLVYQVVWLRLAMASFGVTATVVAIVLSAFMAGLGLGSWLAGRLSPSASAQAALRAYALAELIVALSAETVPRLLQACRSLLLREGSVEWGSTSFHIASGVCITAILLPFCTAMGATFPLAMAALRRARVPGWQRSFGGLYAANVLGAAAGTLASAYVLIELLGFRGTLALAAAINALIAATALLASLAVPAPAEAEAELPRSETDRGGSRGARGALVLLFWTGLCSMAMEVVWVRQYTPWLGNVVYTFAAILAVYLLATFAGSVAWRTRSTLLADPLRSAAWIVLAPAAVLPLLPADPSIDVPHAGAALLALVPFCALLGFLTPMLVDHWSGGDPRRAGAAYAVNIIGCVLGPLVSGFVLLPLLGERWSLAVLALPLLVAGLVAAAGRARIAMAAATAATFAMVLVTRDYETAFDERQVRRDATATVVAAGQGWDRQLLVNGAGMTYLTPITKMMVHLPLAHLPEPPVSGLTICFGMGTSFRSMHSWGISTTVVELVPSVPELFGFFHADGPALLRSPLARVVIDDGRRFLDRSAQEFDVIVVDPPPPVEAAGSSLLYSREFYRSARLRLRPGGILQQWIPGGDRRVVAAFVRALAAELPHVRAFRSIEGWGLHLLASDRPLPARDAQQLAARLPPEAGRDLVEWGPHDDPAAQLDAVLRTEIPADHLAPRSVPPLTDEHPLNEYYWLRRTLAASYLRLMRQDETVREGPPSSKGLP